MTFLLIAWRNILRNYRRSLITILAIAVGFAGLIFAQGFFGGENTQMLRNATAIFSGYIQLHRQGYIDDPSVNKQLPAVMDVEKALSSNKNIAAYSPRVEGSGLIATDNKSTGGFIIGIDPVSELQTSTISRTIVSGRYLSPDDHLKAMTGIKLAEKMKLGVGSTAVVLTQSVDGAIAAQKYEIVGIYDTKVGELDSYSLMITLPDAQELYSLGSGITGITIKLADPGSVDRVIAELKPLEASGVEIDKWDRLMPTVASEIIMNNVNVRFMLLVTLIILAIGIINTISMAMLERGREFGMMMALGTTGRQIFIMVICEAVLLGILGSLLGSAAGLLINGYYSVKGIDLSAYSEVVAILPGLSPVIYTTMEPDSFIITAFWIILVTVLASVSPALRTSGLEPVEAIRGVHRMQENTSVNIPVGFIPFRDIFWLIAWRNIIRNRNRSAITILAIGAGLAGFIFFASVLTGIYAQLLDNGTRYLVGDIQVMNSDYHIERSPSFVIGDMGAVGEAIKGQAGIKSYVQRIEQEAIVSTPDSSANILLLGIEPENEKGFSGFDRILKEGKYLTSANRNGILLGDKLAAKIKAGVGDKVVLTSQDSIWSISSEAFRVVGIINTGADSFDGVLAIANLGTVQSMLAMEGVSVMMLKVADQGELEKIKTSLALKLHDSGNIVLSWKDIAPIIEQFLMLARDSLNIIGGVIFGVTIFSVINTVLISILERTREFGLMSAMGTSRGRVIRVVFLEALILGSFGVIAGNIMGAVITIFLSIVGFNISFLAPGVSLDFIPGMELIIYPVYDAHTVLYPSIVIFILSLLICLYPAWRAASLDPVKALRYT